MEEQRVKNKHGKKKTQITLSVGGGGGGIGGLIVLGGALAITSVIAVAAFASKRNRKKGENEKPKLLNVVPEEMDKLGCQIEDEASLGLSSKLNLVQDSKAIDQNSCCTGYEMSKTSEEKLEPKPKDDEENTTFIHQEIALSDDSLPESVQSMDETGVVEEGLSLIFDDPRMYREKMGKIEYEEGLFSKEIIDVDNENGMSDTTTDTEHDANENGHEEEDDDKDVVEDAQESSEGTERTSMDSTEAVIWPTELIGEPELESGETKINPSHGDEHEKADGAAKTEEFINYYNGSDGDVTKGSYCYDTENTESAALILNAKAHGPVEEPEKADVAAKTEEFANRYNGNDSNDSDGSEGHGSDDTENTERAALILNAKAKGSVELNDQPLHTSKLRLQIMLILLLALMLLIVLLAHLSAMSYYRLDSDSGSAP
ncbi:putative Transmembrane protein [Quillaja saponaria]|uniref:Transmembrane protein n=1 Tax=Quillaja saponaria TaxID=32244 RepID=A0AAD7Q1A2_QUISA|nr:putative Transmembrane protein [Quillaja saponaria]